MEEEKNLKLSKSTFATLCKMLDDKEIRYQKDEEKLTIDCTITGEDLPMQIRILINPDIMLITLLSQIPCIIPEEKRQDASVAVNMVNFRMNDGSFDFNIKDGVIFFRMTASFMDSLISESLFEYLLFCSCATIDRYNDKFFMLSKGLCGIDEFDIKE